MNDELEVFYDQVFLPSFPYRSVNENWVLFRNKIITLVDKYIPLISISNDNKNPWFNKTLKSHRSKKKRLYKIAKRTSSPSDWEKYKDSLKEYCSEVSKAKSKYFTHDLPSMLNTNPKKFWQVISPRNATSSVSIQDANHMPLSDVDSASVLNSFFSSVFTCEDHSRVPEVSELDYTFMAPIAFSAEGIAILIGKLK